MASKTILFIGLITLIAVCAAAACYFIITKKHKKRELETLAERKTWQDRRAACLLNSYNNLIAFWIKKFEEETQELKACLKVDPSAQEGMLSEYISLNDKKHKKYNVKDGATENIVTTFNSREYSHVIPFVGEDKIFYAICFSKNDSFGEYEINLIAYAKDKFLNKLVEPVEYDTLYIPTEFIDSSWLIKPCYLEAEAIYE